MLTECLQSDKLRNLDVTAQTVFANEDYMRVREIFTLQVVYTISRVVTVLSNKEAAAIRLQRLLC